MMIEGEIKTKQPKTKAAQQNTKWKNEERKREEIGISSIWKGEADWWFIGELIKKIFIRMAEILSRADALQVDWNAYQECVWI